MKLHSCRKNKSSRMKQQLWKQRLGKAQARARTYTDNALGDLHKAEGYQQQTLQQQENQKQFYSKKRQTSEIGSARELRV